MRKLVTLLFTGLCFLTVHSQITLTQEDLSLPLTQYIRYTDTLPASISPGPDGAGQTWNFTTLANHETDTILFTKPEWTQYGTNFPTSNLCMITTAEDVSFMYLKLNTDSLVVVGTAGKFAISPDDIIVPFNPSQKIADLPSTYLDGFANISSFNITQYFGLYGFDSIRVTDTTFTQSEFDAWGSITTGLGTYDALRSKVEQISKDLIEGYVAATSSWVDITSLAGGGTDTTKRYGWWTNELGYMILEMDVDPMTDSVLNVKYLATLPQPGGFNQYEINGGVVLYPNPASGSVNISTPVNTSVVEVYNNSGQLLKSVKTLNMSTMIDISGLPSGTYIIRVTGTDGFTLCHKSLIVE